MNRYSGKTPLDRFNSYYTKSDGGCWIWNKTNRDNGYVDFVVNGKKIRAHIWSYIHFKGGYDRKLDIDHVCHNGSGCAGGNSCQHRRCVNPDHLEPVTRSVNSKRGECGSHLSNRTHCINGHEFSKENTQFRNGGHRRCKKCRTVYG